MTLRGTATPPATAGAAERLASSFRDPSGYVFRCNGTIFRRVEPSFRESYERLMASGLYADLRARQLLVQHEEVDPAIGGEGAYKVLQPARIAFISHPFEWCFSQLRDAALATLEIQDAALRRGMVLRDASAYNIQFAASRPQLIDTLSLGERLDNAPWVAYGQFCRNFLAPLALMSRVDPGLSQLLRVHLDGIPLDLASNCLPWHTRLRPGLALHLHLHAAAQRRFAIASAGPRRQAMTQHQLLALTDSLRSTVLGLRWEPGRTQWANYYEDNHNYGAALAAKEALVKALLPTGARMIWDLGANTGRFSRIASRAADQVVSWDIDAGCVELNYREVRRSGTANLLPLQLDLTNPSPGLGWALAERESLLARANADVVLALGLIHHLVIANNVPLAEVFTLLAQLGPQLLVEFIPKQDSQVMRMLASRADIFVSYNQSGFERALCERYSIERREQIPGTLRWLYLARRLPGPAPAGAAQS